MSLFGKDKEKEKKSQEERARRKFMAETSFAIRNPLNTICGVSEIIRKNVEEDSEKELILSYLKVLIDAEIELQHVVDGAFKNYEKMELKQEEKIEAKPQEMNRDMIKNLRMMVVDDSGVSQLIAKEMLEDYGAIVTTCDSGNEAVDTFRNSITGTFDVIFMDINMPGMDGYEAADSIRNCNHSQAKDIPIIAMTAEALADDVQMALQSGMNAHISKPISIDKILSALNSIE